MATATEQNLTKSPLVNGFPYLVNKRAAQKLTLVEASFSLIFVRKFCCDEIFCFKFPNFSDGCFVISWEYCNECLQSGYVDVYCILLAYLHCQFNALLSNLKQNNSHCTAPYNLSTFGTSLVVQWLRIRLPTQGTQVRALVGEDPTCRGAAKPVHHNY